MCTPTGPEFTMTAAFVFSYEPVDVFTVAYAEQMEERAHDADRALAEDEAASDDDVIDDDVMFDDEEIDEEIDEEHETVGDTPDTDAPQP
jgi:phosphopantothenoylcysteine synthetase/decarboxylase